MAEKPTRITWLEKTLSFLTPKQWTMAAVSAVLIFIVIFGIIPKLKIPSPQFIIDENTVRGESIILISPAGDIETVPPHFTWNTISKNEIEYKIYVYREKLLWTATTQENTISLPEEVKKQMTAGQKYYWMVKAFSANGSLIAVSPKIQFTITPP